MSDEQYWRAINGRVVFPRTDGQLPGADHDFAIMGGQKVAETLAESINAQLDAKAALLDEREEEMRTMAYLLRDALMEGQGITGRTHTEGGKAWREALTRLRDVTVYDTKGG